METVKNYIEELKEKLNGVNLEEVENVIEILLKAYNEGKSIFIMGNGGSAATASHFACDLGKGTLKNHYDMVKKRFRVYSLTDNVATITAYGNDLNYEDIFSQQLVNLVRPGDVLIGITASGNSKNILKAFEVGNDNNVCTIGFLGFDGGKACGMVDHKIIVDSRNYGVIEDIHLMLEHMICASLNKRINSDIFK